MTASYNRVIIVGNLTRDVELKFTQGETAVTEIGLATNNRRKDGQGKWVDDPVFVDVTLWGRLAEIADQYCSKGTSVLIEGRLKLDTWETDSQKRSKLRVVGERLQMLGTPKASDDAVGKSELAGVDASASFGETPDDDAPF